MSRGGGAHDTLRISRMAWLLRLQPSSRRWPRTATIPRPELLTPATHRSRHAVDDELPRRWRVASAIRSSRRQPRIAAADATPPTLSIRGFPPQPLLPIHPWSLPYLHRTPTMCTPHRR
jgi:hypothetical protein